MDLEYIFIQMEHFIKDNGRMINKREKEKKLGLMVQNTKEITLKVKNKVQEKSFLLMVQFIKASFTKMIFMEQEFILGIIKKFMKDNGFKIK